jgi:hypothetical protein
MAPPPQRRRPLRPPTGPSAAEAERALETMAAWLAHPSEFGERPRAVRLLGTYPRVIMSLGPDPVPIFLIAYEMPSGKRGRGFVNPITWSFIGDELDAIPDADLVTAYTGWAFLFPQLQDGSIQTEFAATTLPSFKAFLTKCGVTDVTIDDTYLVGDSELFEFTGSQDGTRLRGAGNEETRVFFTAGMPQMHLPAIYWLFGAIQAGT